MVKLSVVYPSLIFLVALMLPLLQSIGPIMKNVYYLKAKNPVNTGHKLNVHKTFRRRLRRLSNVLCTFTLCLVSAWKKSFVTQRNSTHWLWWISSKVEIMPILKHCVWTMITSLSLCCITWWTSSSPLIFLSIKKQRRSSLITCYADRVSEPLEKGVAPGDVKVSMKMYDVKPLHAVR